MYNNILNTVNYTNKHMQLSGSYDSLLNNKNILELHIGNNHANLLNQAYNTYYSSFDTVWNEKKKNKWVHHLVDLQLKESDSLLISYLLKTYRVNGLFYAFEGEKLHKTRMLPMAYAKKQIPSLRILLQKKANYVPNVSIDMLDNIAWKQSKATQQNLVILTLCKLY